MKPTQIHAHFASTDPACNHSRSRANSVVCFALAGDIGSDKLEADCVTSGAVGGTSTMLAVGGFSEVVLAGAAELPLNKVWVPFERKIPPPTLFLFACSRLSLAA